LLLLTLVKSKLKRKRRMSASEASARRDITVWLVEDNHTFRKTLVRALSRAEGVVCAGHFANAEDALEALARTEPPPDVLLLDLELPGLSGLEAIKSIKLISPATHILILTVFDDSDKIFRAIRAGASGYQLKTSALSEIVNSIQEVMIGGAPLAPKVARSVLRMFAHLTAPEQDYGLTEREQRVLELMAKGLIKKQIAEELALSYHTVDTHIRNIYGKLHVHSDAGAVGKALSNRLL
jgi:DNA-binding NarL/FixJ family response regulator